METQLLSTAKIGKTHGVEGFLRIYSLSGEYSHLKKLDSCIVRFPDGSENTLDVESIRIQGDLFLYRFKGYDSPEKARKLSNGIIMIPRQKAPKLEKGEYYVADLYGMDVISEGDRVGVVLSVSDGPQALLLEVERISDKKRFMVPLLDVYIANVDIKNNTLDLLMSELIQ